MKIYLVIPLLLFAAGCSRSPIDKARDAFIDGCTDGGGSKATCHCVFERLEKIYTTDQLIRLTNDPDSLPPDFLDQEVAAARQCAASS